MKPRDSSELSEPSATPQDAAFDAALRQCFQSEAEPDDDGFSQRVMRALPARPAHQILWQEWVQRAQWTAMSLAACGIAILTSGTGAPAHSVAAYTLIGLLTFWAIPSRWSRG
jgi:hypothetical protein